MQSTCLVDGLNLFLGWNQIIAKEVNKSRQHKQLQRNRTIQLAMYLLLWAPIHSFFFSSHFFLLFFFNIFLSTRSTREWTTKCFTAIRCKILSIEKQVDAPIIERELAYSKTQSSRTNLGIYFFQTKSVGHQRMENFL